MSDEDLHAFAEFQDPASDTQIEFFIYACFLISRGRLRWNTLSEPFGQHFLVRDANRCVMRNKYLSPQNLRVEVLIFENVYFKNDTVVL